MKRTILYEAVPLHMSLTNYMTALVVGLVMWFILGIVAGLFGVAMLLFIFYFTNRKIYIETSKNPILLNFEGIHWNLITKDLGGEHLPWTEISEITEISRPSSKDSVIKIKLAPGLYFENWRELKLANKFSEPCFLLDAKPYNAEHKDMLYFFRSYHEEFGLKGTSYESLEADPNPGKSNTSRLLVGAIFGYSVVIYSLVSGRFPTGIDSAFYRESKPEFFWLSIITFSLISTWGIKDIYISYRARQQSETKNTNTIQRRDSNRNT